MNNNKEKEEIINFATKLNTTNLSPLRSGNISVKGEHNNTKGFFITPSGLKYENLKSDDIVFLPLNHNDEDLAKLNLKRKPSSEWRFHQDIYKNKKEAKAIVHAHSPHAAAISAHEKSIPAFHYMVALAGGEDIKCSKYATFGTKELSNNIISALNNRKACLMANHGQVAFGENLSTAFELAQEVENICHQYVIALKLGEPKILSLEEMKRILAKVKDYKSE